MSILKPDTLDCGAVVVNVGESGQGGYVMVEHINGGVIQITVFNDEGDVLLEREYNTIAHPEI